MHCADTWVNIWHNRAHKKSNKYFQPKKWLYQILSLMTVELRLYNQSTIAHLASGQHYKHKLSNKNNYLLASSLLYTGTYYFKRDNNFCIDIIM